MVGTIKRLEIGHKTWMRAPLPPHVIIENKRDTDWELGAAHQGSGSPPGPGTRCGRSSSSIA